MDERLILIISVLVGMAAAGLLVGTYLAQHAYW